MTGILLGVNVDHVATLRQARRTPYPDPVAAALIAESAGADSITVHLREDRRHIQERDVTVLRERLRSRLNLEMAVTSEMLMFAAEVRPAECCLVPERREELTTEGGLDVISMMQSIAAACEQLSSVGTRTALFIDPDHDQIKAAAEAGAPVIELHTGSYADADSDDNRQRELERIRSANVFAQSLGLEVHAGHGLTHDNVGAIAAMPGITELNIGHAIIADAVFIGLAAAVTRMKRAMVEARGA